MSWPNGTGFSTSTLGGDEVAKPDFMGILNDQLRAMMEELADGEERYLRVFWDLTDPEYRHLLRYAGHEDTTSEWNSLADNNVNMKVTRVCGPLWCDLPPRPGGPMDKAALS